MTQQPELLKRLGLVDATSLVVGSMIGSGVFIVAADISRQVGSPGLMLTVWIVTAILTAIAALSYGELAAAMPHAGGQYVYLREAFGPLAGFLFGWTFFLVIQTGTIAAVAVAFAKFLGVLMPSVSAANVLVALGPVKLTTQQLVAIAVLVVLTWVNTRGVRTGANVQNVFTAAKALALVLLIGAAFLYGDRKEVVTWGAAQWDWSSVRLVGVAMVGALFSADAWCYVTFTAGETRNPSRNIPLSLVLGVFLVSALYIACNYAYLLVLPFEAIQTAADDRVATAAVAAIMGSSAVQLMAAAIMISTFGCVNGLALAGARVYYAMALDRLFFERLAKIDPQRRTPVNALWAQCLWACLLTLSGSYGDLLDYVIFAVLLFYILTIAGVFVLRFQRPDLERPYRAFGYPVMPAIYIAAGGLIEVLLLLYKPQYTWPGLLIVLTGVPVYYVWRRR